MSLPPIYTICKHRNRLFPLMKVFWKDWCPVKLCDPRTVGTGTHFVKKAKPEKTTLFLSLIRKLCFCEHWQTCFLSVMITFEQILIKLCEGVDTCGVYCQHIKSTVRSFKMSCHIWPLTFPSRPSKDQSDISIQGMIYVDSKYDNISSWHLCACSNEL